MASSTKRVLIIVQNLPVPFDRRVWLEATSLTEAGYAVTVICPKLRGYNKGYEQLEGVDIFRYALPIQAGTSKLGFVFEFAWAWAMTALLSLRVALFGRGFDVIHACNPPETYWLLGWMWKRAGKRFLFDHHDLSPEMYSAKYGERGGMIYRALLALERFTFRTADVVITTNESHRQIAIERGGVSPDRVFVVRSGPDLSRFVRTESDPRWRAGREHAIAYLGDINSQDGVDGLVRVMRFLREDFGREDVHCVVIGSGPHWEQVKNLAVDLGVSGLMTFTGFVSDSELCTILSSVDAGIDPVPRNDWSERSTMNKIVEYMYFGLPVVAYDLSETRRSAGEAGIYAHSDEEKALAEAVVELLSDDERRIYMGEVGSARIENQLAWQYSIEPLLAAYNTLPR